MKEIRVSGCKDCPACRMLDMGNGFLCILARFDEEGNHQYINANKYDLPITPEWCPLKSESILLTCNKK